uniref:Uncharacterized protein n=1 Tax=Octopus bimaculoides TaxID=37653 RepID=A0A0L8HBN0_OCTBM
MLKEGFKTTLQNIYNNVRNFWDLGLRHNTGEVRPCFNGVCNKGKMVLQHCIGQPHDVLQLLSLLYKVWVDMTCPSKAMYDDSLNAVGFNLFKNY